MRLLNFTSKLLFAAVTAAFAAIIVAFVFVLLLATPVLGGEVEAEAITEAGIIATVDPESGLVELDDIAQDPRVSPECRDYADFLLATTVVLFSLEDWPGNVSLDIFYQNLRDYIPQAYFDCEVSL
jgi:hypothetical protein